MDKPRIVNPCQIVANLMQAKTEEPIVQSFTGLPDEKQAEQIADQFSEISNSYGALKNDDINLDEVTNTKPYPCIEPYFVQLKIKEMKNKSATIPGDILIKVIQRFGYELSFPLSDIYKRCCKHGEYPDIWKSEVVTPVPKIHPPQTPENLRKISGTLNFSW